MNYQQTMEYINSFTKSGKPVKDLSRIRRLLTMLGNPQNDLKFIHVAGTNGKGSTVEMISNALIYANYNVGSFTSPYMVCYEDRIRFNGENIPQDELSKVATMVRSYVHNDEFSQFEISMAIAFIYFKSKRCDIVVLETGIGGLVDSTNIIENPLVSVITSISLDHTAILGNTLKDIAIQKAGIIKPNRPTILSCDNTNADVIKVISEMAMKKHSKFILPTSGDILNMSLHGETFNYKHNIYSIKMLGKHQVSNAITVIEVCNLLGSMGYNIPLDCVKRSLESTQVIFRTQTFTIDGVSIVVDGSHNIGGITALKDTLQACGIDKPIILTGMISTKDYTSCCKVLNSFADMVICTDGYMDNSISKDKLSKLFTCKTITCELDTALESALKMAKSKGTSLIVCGSLYMLTKIFVSTHARYIIGVRRAYIDTHELTSCQ
ncbi:MAG: bifunctional tetrahydrofolate synthase/dihydrofolate synthase [Ruminococcus sp.]|nr:bifunctional tetrahydrofolate synthase/dihydrofolate synthase [Ruminococcus sp.]